MNIKQLVDEDFVNYKKASMFIGFPKCTFKCDVESNKQVCQNSALAASPDIEIDPSIIVERYMNNPITEAVVIGGLEPFDSFTDLNKLIYEFRQKTNDDIVIYTGYYPEEINEQIHCLKLNNYKNIIVKFGRFIPDQQKHKDELLGIELASPNQYAAKIS